MQPEGALLDEILDLSLWLQLSDDAGAKAKQMGLALGEQQTAKAYTQGRLDALPDPIALQDAAKAWEQEAKDRFESVLAELEKTEKGIEAGKAYQAKLVLARAEVPPPVDVSKEEAELKDLQRRLNNLEHDKQAAQKQERALLCLINVPDMLTEDRSKGSRKAS